jgi:hypothetical protein
LKERDALRKVPTSPRHQLYLLFGTLHEVHPVSSAQELDLRPLRMRDHVYTMTFVRLNVETFPKDAANPATRYRSVVLGAIPLYKSGGYYSTRKMTEHDSYNTVRIVVS